MNILCGHITLRQQINHFPSGCMHRYIGHNHRMAGASVYNQYIAWLQLRPLGIAQLLVQRQRAAPCKHGFQVMLPVAVSRMLPALGPVGVIAETNGLTHFFEIFRTQAHDGIGTLLKVFLSYGDIEYRILSR